MSIKLTGLVLGTAFAATALVGCQSTTPTNGNTAANRANSNTAVVVNSNGNTAMPVTTTNTTSSTGNGNYTWNGNITREEWEKDKANYANRAKEAGSTIGSGANDAWIWTKTRAALSTTADLRDSTINVDVNNDVITLRGTVANAAQKTKAVAVAKGIEGQKGIKDELKVAAADSVTNTGTTTDSTKTNSNTNR